MRGLKRGADIGDREDIEEINPHPKRYQPDEPMMKTPNRRLLDGADDSSFVEADLGMCITGFVTQAALILLGQTRQVNRRTRDCAGEARNEAKPGSDHVEGSPHRLNSLSDNVAAVTAEMRDSFNNLKDEMRQPFNNLIIRNGVTRDLAQKSAQLAISPSQRVTKLEQA